LLNAYGSESQINGQLNKFSKELTPGIYLIRGMTDGSEQVFNQKLIKL